MGRSNASSAGKEGRGAAQHDAQSLGDRLREAIRDSPLGTARAFSDALADAEITPSGYRTLLTYTAGGAEPSLEWIARASALLGVRPEWLAWGTGPRSLAEQAGAAEREEMVAGIAEAFPPFAGLAPWQQGAVVQTIAEAVGSSTWASDPRRAGTAAGRALTAGLEAFGLRLGRVAPDDAAAVVGASLPLLGALASLAAREGSRAA